MITWYSYSSDWYLSLSYRVMFITDFSLPYFQQSKIVKVSMDGSRYQVIINTKIKRPQGITVDIVNRKIYWVDSLRDIIETADYYGDSR